MFTASAAPRAPEQDGIAIAFCAEDERAYLKDIRKLTDADFERLPLPDNFRAVVEGVGPTKREQKPRMARPKVTPRGGEGSNARPNKKHPSRAGQPRREGAEGQAQGGRPSRGRNRRRANR